MDKMLEKKELKKTDVFKICSTFDKQEATKCLVFLAEFTNASKKCRMLFEEIYKHYKKNNFDWNNVKITIPSLNKKFFGSEKDNNAARVLRSELYKNLKAYCRFLNFQKKKKRFDSVNFLDYLADKKEVNLFIKEYNKIEKNIKIEKDTETEVNHIFKIGIDYVKLNHLSYESFLELILMDQSKKNKVDYHLHYENFSHFSVLQKIQNYCLILNHHLIEKQKVNTNIENEIESLFLKAKKNPSIKLIAEVYETASLMLKNDKLQYNKLKKFLLNEKNNISKKDKQILYIFMHNFCIASNDPNLLNESRINHLRQFDERLLHDQAHIRLMNAKSLCTTILNLTRSSDKTIKMTKAEAELKIKDVIKEMHPEHKVSTEYFHLAILDFFFDDYKSSAKKLKKSPKYPNAFFDFDARTILQRCYYFLDDIDEFDKGIKNFQSALRNDQDLAKKHKTEYLNFTSAIQILKKAKLVHDKNDKKKLLNKLEGFLQKKPVKVLNWFNTQIQALE